MVPLYRINSTQQFLRWVLVRLRRGAQHNIGSLLVTKRDLQELCFTVHADPAQLADVFYQVVRNLLICRRAGLFFKGEIRIH